jgi:hypothetical protein
MTTMNPISQGRWADNDEQWDNVDDDGTVPRYPCPDFLASCAREVFLSSFVLPAPKTRSGRGIFLVVMYLIS